MVTAAMALAAQVLAVAGLRSLSCYLFFSSLLERHGAINRIVTEAECTLPDELNSNNVQMGRSGRFFMIRTFFVNRRESGR